MEALLDATTGQPDDLADLAGELVFAPKELKVAQDLSERLGYATVSGRTRSRPSGLSNGHRTLSESAHRRALMLPQELIQMAPDRLIVLRAGTRPVRGRKIAYFRERAFRLRLLPPPAVPPRPIAGLPRPADWVVPTVTAGDDALDLDVVAPLLSAAGLAPPPARGASETEVEAWVEQFLDAATPAPALEASHGR